MIALLCLLWVLAAPPGPTEADPATLYPILEEAYRLYEAGRFDAAIVAFERAYAASPEPRFVLNIAVSHRDAGRCARALADFDRFFGICAACPQLEAARTVLADTQRQCTPTIEVRTHPISALITIDGDARGSAPLKLALPVGPHVLRGRRNAHRR